MKSLYLFIILILLILVVYYHNKSSIYEKVEHFDDSIINQIASIANGEKITLKDVEITGTLTCNGDVNVSKDNTFTAPNITTRYLSSTKENGDYINFNCGLFNPNDNKLGTITSGHEGSGRTKIYVNNELVAKNITTRVLSSTDGDNNYIDFNCGLYSPKSTIIGCKSNGSKSSNFLLELDNNQKNRQPVSTYTSNHLAIP